MDLFALHSDHRSVEKTPRSAASGRQLSQSAVTGFVLGNAAHSYHPSWVCGFPNCCCAPIHQSACCCLISNILQLGVHCRDTNHHHQHAGGLHGLASLPACACGWSHQHLTLRWLAVCPGHAGRQWLQGVHITPMQAQHLSQGSHQLCSVCSRTARDTSVSDVDLCGTAAPHAAPARQHSLSAHACMRPTFCRGASVTRRLLVGAGGLLGAAAAAAGAARAEEDARKGEVGRRACAFCAAHVDYGRLRSSMCVRAAVDDKRYAQHPAAASLT